MAGKHKIFMDTPIQIGCVVYQLVKLRMLQFYYDCLDKYVDRSDFHNWFRDETTKEAKAYNKRTPGLFKVEFEARPMFQVILC